MDRITLDWAQDRLRDDVQALGDDPQGYCCDDTTPAEAWRRLEHIARVLLVDPVEVLRCECTPFEVARLGQLVGRDFG